MPISDIFLTNLSNSLGAAAVILIVVYQFVEINAKREAEHLERIALKHSLNALDSNGGKLDEGVLI